MKQKTILPFTTLLLNLLICVTGSAQDLVERVEPPNWWAGMVHHEVELLVYGENIAQYQIRLDHDQARLIRQTRVENPNYLFLEIRLDESIDPGQLSLEFLDDGKVMHTHEYPILERTGLLFDESVDASDVMYLITPDRFANGNPANDEIAGMPDKLNRAERFGRHGGDIQGIVDRLDYIRDLGFTAIWLNPVIENDMPAFSYHGYAATDFYAIDARFGSNEEYRIMVERAAQKDIKIVMDMIMNHCGSEHWFVLDPPTSDWINFGGAFVPTSHQRMTVQDIHASEFDKRAFSDGWFVETMPDMNQRNPLMARYLIQNTLWWIEYSRIAGIRMDTYPYPDKDFMTDWTCAIEREYPGFFIVGEEWTTNPAVVAYWQKNKLNHDGYTSCLPSLMDFPMQNALAGSMNKEASWGSDWAKTYEVVASDFLYADPYALVVFPDNHDMARFYTQVQNDLDLFKMGVVFFSTIRGIPQFYYGTEILMNSDEEPNDHGIIRSDFPGGWKGDMADGFSGKGLSRDQLDARYFFRKVLNWRKSNPVIHKGKLMQFVPEKDVYSFVRYAEEGKVFVLFNKSKKPVTVDLKRYREIIPAGVEAYNVLEEKTVLLEDSFTMKGRSAMILEIGN
jgi:glycosidase